MSWFKKAPTYDSAEEQALVRELREAVNKVNCLLERSRKIELHVNVSTNAGWEETDSITFRVHKHVW